MKVPFCENMAVNRFTCVFLIASMSFSFCIAATLGARESKSLYLGERKVDEIVDETTTALHGRYGTGIANRRVQSEADKYSSASVHGNNPIIRYQTQEENDERKDSGIFSSFKHEMTITTNGKERIHAKSVHSEAPIIINNDNEKSIKFKPRSSTHSISTQSPSKETDKLIARINQSDKTIEDPVKENGKERETNLRTQGFSARTSSASDNVDSSTPASGGTTHEPNRIHPTKGKEYESGMAAHSSRDKSQSSETAYGIKKQEDDSLHERDYESKDRDVSKSRYGGVSSEEVQYHPQRGFKSKSKAVPTYANIESSEGSSGNQNLNFKSKLEEEANPSKSNSSNGKRADTNVTPIAEKTTPSRFKRETPLPLKGVDEILGQVSFNFNMSLKEGDSNSSGSFVGSIARKGKEIGFLVDKAEINLRFFNEVSDEIQQEDLKQENVFLKIFKYYSSDGKDEDSASTPGSGLDDDSMISSFMNIYRSFVSGLEKNDKN